MSGRGTPKDAASTELAGIQAVIETSAGPMTLEFLPAKAPGHVANFVKLAEQGFYDGTVFHRTIKGFMIQGGCPQGTGRGGPGYMIKAEFNDVHHARGVLSMARSTDPDSAGSQFFIVHGEAGFLDRQYTAFGRLVDGDATLEKIATAPTKPPTKQGGENSSPMKPVKIERVRIVRPARDAGAGGH